MKRTIAITCALAATALWIPTAITVQAAASGEQLFKQHCSPCHPNGDNIVNPKKTLHKADRQANQVNTVEAIVAKTRNPGPGMSKFDTTVLSDSDAKAIAEYILRTF